MRPNAGVVPSVQAVVWPAGKPMIRAHNLSDLESRTKLLGWQERGLTFTRTGYGRKIPTTKMVRLPGSPRWRRVYCCIFSNIGTCYVTAPHGDWIVIR